MEGAEEFWTFWKCSEELGEYWRVWSVQDGTGGSLVWKGRFRRVKEVQEGPEGSGMVREYPGGSMRIS